jgi:hypothetical protein
MTFNEAHADKKFNKKYFNEVKESHKRYNEEYKRFTNDKEKTLAKGEDICEHSDHNSGLYPLIKTCGLPVHKPNRYCDKHEAKEEKQARKTHKNKLHRIRESIKNFLNDNRKSPVAEVEAEAMATPAASADSAEPWTTKRRAPGALTNLSRILGSRANQVSIAKQAIPKGFTNPNNPLYGQLGKYNESKPAYHQLTGSEIDLILQDIELQARIAELEAALKNNPNNAINAQLQQLRIRQEKLAELLRKRNEFRTQQIQKKEYNKLQDDIRKYDIAENALERSRERVQRKEGILKAHQNDRTRKQLERKINMKKALKNLSRAERAVEKVHNHGITSKSLRNRIMNLQKSEFTTAAFNNEQRRKWLQAHGLYNNTVRRPRSRAPSRSRSRSRSRSWARSRSRSRSTSANKP